MRIGYFGDGIWAHKAFEKFIRDDTIELVFVTVRYDKRDKVLLELSEKHRIPVELSDNINSPEFIDRMKTYEADLFVSMSFNQIFKREMIDLPKYGTINCHAGKLPFYRGRNILNWALINDEKEFGITVHYMDEGIDTGDIIVQRTYPIGEEDDYGTLLARAYDGCAEVLYQAVERIRNHEVKRIRQADIDPVGTYFGIRCPGDEVVDWKQSSREIFNFIRALCRPGPQAVSWIRGKKIQMNRARMVEGAHVYKSTAGQVIGRTKEGFLIKTGDTMLEVTEYSYEGKIRTGDRLGNHE